MLSCFVSAVPSRAAVAVSVAEAASAADLISIALSFGVTINQPASATETLDAFIGDIMNEAAHAVSVVDAGLFYNVRIDEPASAAVVVSLVATSPTLSAAVTEPATASDFPDATRIADAAVTEPATASDFPDATRIAGLVFEGVVALDGPITPSTLQPTVIYIEG